MLSSDDNACAVLVQCCDNTAHLKTPIDTVLSARLVQCAVLSVAWIHSSDVILGFQVVIAHTSHIEI